MATKKNTSTSTTSKRKSAIPQTTGTQMAMQSMRNYLIVMIAVTTLVVLAGGYFIYNLVQSNIKKGLEVRAQEYQIKLSEAKIVKLERAEPELAKLKQAEGEGISRFDFITQRTLPTTEDFEAILTIFNRLQADELINIESIAKSTSTATATTGSTPTPASTADGKSQSSTIAVKASGSRDSIIGYLEALEASARIFDFSTMEIQVDDQGAYTLDMDYKIYSFPKPSIKSSSVKIDEYEKDKGKYE